MGEGTRKGLSEGGSSPRGDGGGEVSVAVRDSELSASSGAVLS